MTSESQDVRALVIAAADGGYYAIPWAVVETGRVKADELPDPEVMEKQGDVRGFGGRALLPYVEGDDCFALPLELIERHRVPQDREAAMARVIEEDVAGFYLPGAPFGPSGEWGSQARIAAGARVSALAAASGGPVTIINQYNIAMGVNLIYNSPGAVASISQTGINKAG